MNSPKGLFVWEASIELAVKMIELSDKFLERRRFAIADQITRSALSVPSNIAEGEGRATKRDRRHYFVQARGSLYELETQLEVITRARLAKDNSDTRGMIRKISAGLCRIIEDLDERRPLSSGRLTRSRARRREP